MHQIFWSIVIGISALPLALLGQPDALPLLRIVLDPQHPSKSRGELLSVTGQPSFTFSVGFGRNGVSPAGARFRPGYSLLGAFRINAILSVDRFEMEESLVVGSSKTRSWLADHLFANMNSIDFDGDGQSGEYGAAFIGLEPLPPTVAQPFGFQTYRRVFRWYSYALHGNRNDARVGECRSGGCVNTTKAALEHILPSLRLGDRVEILEAQRR